jgi:DNA N-6-adenine-methyltransferase (Dam).
MNIDWYTPKEIIESLGEFDLDPASCADAIKLNNAAKKYYTKEDDGLKQKWEGRVWLNPPYSSPMLTLFLKKMALHNNGIALIDSRVDTKWFHDIILTNASAIKLLYGRIKFYDSDGVIGKQPRNGSILAAFGKENAEILSQNPIKGKYFRLINYK